MGKCVLCGKKLKYEHYKRCSKCRRNRYKLDKEYKAKRDKAFYAFVKRKSKEDPAWAEKRRKQVREATRRWRARKKKEAGK
jgi:hypothetical protein